MKPNGNNVVAGKRTLADSGLPIISGDTMTDAAQKVVKEQEQHP